MSKRQKKKAPLWRRFLRFVLVLVLVVAALAAALIGTLTVLEYKPADSEMLAVEGSPSDTLTEGDGLTVLTWNIGYGALGDNADFFMDGGTHVYTADKARVQENMAAVQAQLTASAADVVFLQEADVNSFRSRGVDEVAQIRMASEGFCSVFALNYKCLFVPFPMPPIGKVESGILTLSAYPIREAVRQQLPVPFSWPVRAANLKRCLEVSRVPLEGSERELVLINLHLEAYDSGEGKTAQTAALRGILDEERAKGNYVIAGGDFNQVFSDTDASMYPTYEGKWQAGAIDQSEFDPSWQFLMDSTHPTCRSLDQPLKGADTENFQYYMIDGFIVSDNIRVDSLETLDLGFVNSDHNPVRMEVTLGA